MKFGEWLKANWLHVLPYVGCFAGGVIVAGGLKEITAARIGIAGLVSAGIILGLAVLKTQPWKKTPPAK